MSDNQKIIKETVMNTLFNMFNGDDLHYRQLKKACDEYPDFKIKEGEYKDIFILYPKSENALKAFNKIADNMPIEKPYIFIGYVNNKWTANCLFAVYKNTQHEYQQKFDTISDPDVKEFMKKFYDFIFK